MKQELVEIMQLGGDFFTKGITVKDRDLEFLEAVAGCVSRGELAVLLADPDWEEAETARELLLFPDLESRARLESVLQGKGLSQEEQDEITAFLKGRVQKTELILPGALKNIMIGVGAADLAAYIKRLHLTVEIPEPLVRALAFCSNKESVNNALALLRSSGICWTGDLLALAQKFIEKNAEKEDFPAVLQKILALFKEIPTDRDPEEYLAEKRTWCLFHLDKARTQERELAGQNMETRLLSGVRTAYADERRLRGQIALIDRILYSMPPLPGL
ncbi:hypothetical protein SAMN02745216_01693 [Desulfatibacillum alkenivorans DSM 16219]|uniref:Uncharacterized protein n=2 Tax=Desulfatibacillum alkenivorans TaxID=259354 RepID=A0A1M6JKB1_9BACT|nr:hypothetical protein SAMN02745216_01693 [Desulfatibacillum alkenivorans DSM 16219]